MKRQTAVLLMSIAAGMITAGAVKAETFTGTITGTMCGAKHTMKITPESKCVKECVRLDPKKWKYGLLVGDNVYALSDQGTPEQFAAQSHGHSLRPRPGF